MNQRITNLTPSFSSNKPRSDNFRPSTTPRPVSTRPISPLPGNRPQSNQPRRPHPANRRPSNNNPRPHDNKKRSNSRPRNYGGGRDRGRERKPVEKLNYGDSHSQSLLKVSTLSGTDSIGRNCSFIELGNEIMIVDCGFGFPSDEQLGIDYLIPNFTYLKKNKSRIKAILITHGHLDHTGALPYLLPELDYPPVYAGRFAKALIDARLEEAGLLSKAKTIAVNKSSELQIGAFKVNFIGLTHSIPNSFGIFVQSPKGNVFFSGDYKMDLDPANEEQSDYAALEALKGKVDLALMESTNASSTGKAKSGKEIESNIEEVVRAHTGRLIVVAFSSIISRIHSIINVAQRTDRKVFVSGRSLLQTVKIAVDLGYIETPEGLIINESRLKEFPDNKILFLCTGSQGEQYGALNRISNNEHKYFKIKANDKVLLAASEIPTNISQISKMTDRLIRLGGEVVQNDTWRIHESGHGMQEDMKMMYEMIMPKAVIPIHGELTRRYKNKANYVAWGMRPETVHLTDDGFVWGLDGNGWRKVDQIESKPIMVDGLGVGDIGDIVLKDRQQLAEYGMVTVILNLSSAGNKLLGRPKFISRGFVYVKHSKELFGELENIVQDSHRSWLNNTPQGKMHVIQDLLSDVEQRMSKYIFKKTEREPMILVVTI